jgi:hypothetical protein
VTDWRNLATSRLPVIDVTRGTAFYEAACGMEQQLAEEHRALLQAEAGLEAAKGK